MTGPYLAGHVHSPAKMAVHRCSTVDQRVLQMIRGEHDERSREPPSQIQLGLFERLRGLATRNGLVIQSPGAPFLSRDELRLLSWLSLAQRVATYARPFHSDSKLTLTIVHCAGILEAMGLRIRLRATV
jgi:hypothetical protein